MLKWRAAARTDAGCQRQRNEDNYYVSPDNRVFAVADGMGSRWRQSEQAGDGSCRKAVERRKSSYE